MAFSNKLRKYCDRASDQPMTTRTANDSDQNSEQVARFGLRCHRNLAVSKTSGSIQYDAAI